MLIYNGLSFMEIKKSDILLSYLFPRNLEKMHSEMNPVLEISLVNGVPVLDAAHANYSYGGLHRLFQNTFKRLKTEAFRSKKVLILGFGAGSVARIIQEEYGLNCQITGVEADSKIISIAKDYFQTEQINNLNLIEGDATEYLAANQKLFDLIVVDIYIDRDVPAQCQDESFIVSLKEHLEPKGLVLFNKMIYDKKTSEEADKLEKYFIQHFRDVENFKFRERSTNWVFIGSQEDLNDYL